MMFRIGQGFDVHQLVEGRPLIIGGITIPYEKGLLGHSDADVFCILLRMLSLGRLVQGILESIFLIPILRLKMRILLNYLSMYGIWLKDEGYQLSQCGLYNYCPKSENGTIY